MARSRWWAVAALSVSPGARAYYDQRRAAGDTRDAALRHLASKLIGQLHHCLAHRLLYDEATAWPQPQHHQDRKPLDTARPWSV